MDESNDHFAAIRASADDLRRAADRALKRAGLTETELREQAARNDFESLQSRLAWLVVSGLEPPNAKDSEEPIDDK